VEIFADHYQFSILLLYFGLNKFFKKKSSQQKFMPYIENQKWLDRERIFQPKIVKQVNNFTPSLESK